MSFKKLLAVASAIALFILPYNNNPAYGKEHTLKFICDSDGKIIVIKKINKGGYNNIFCIIDKIQFSGEIEINISKYLNNKKQNEELIFIEKCPNT
jgi:hypothetical protein